LSANEYVQVTTSRHFRNEEEVAVGNQMEDGRQQQNLSAKSIVY